VTQRSKVKLFHCAVDAVADEEDSLGPSLEGGDGEESQHAVEDVVKVQPGVGPFPWVDLQLMQRPLLVPDVPASGSQRGAHSSELQSGSRDPNDFNTTLEDLKHECSHCNVWNSACLSDLLTNR